MTCTIHGRTRGALVLWALALVLPASASGAGRDAWWHTAWQRRLWFEVPHVSSGMPGPEVGVVEFLSGDLLEPDASDLRVVAASGKPVPHRLLVRRDSDDFVRVAFELLPGMRRYAVYLSNPRAKPARPTAGGRGARLRRGLLLQTFELRGGSPGNLAGMRDVLKRAEKRPFGADFVPNVFLGYNPFGPSDRFASRFTGWLMAPGTGTYTFATTSDDASFLLVDGKLVTKWPGSHGAVRDARFSGKASLTRGAHRLEYLHVNSGGPAIMVAAWKPPSAKRIVPIPPAAFAPVAKGKFLSAEALGGRLAPHFEAGVAAECWFEERYAYRVAFRDRTGGAPGGRVVSWDFGDGLRATGGAVEHVYLRDGVYRVTMTVRAGGAAGKVQKVEKLTSRLRVGRIWREQTRDVSEPPARFARVVRAYDLGALDGRSLEAAALLFKAAGAVPDEVRVLRAVVARPAEVGEQVYFEAVLFLVRRWREGARTRPAAMKLLDRAETHLAGKGGLRARVCCERGDVLFYYAGEPDRALGEYDKVVGRFAEKLEDHIVRETKIRIGDVYRKKGDFEKAHAAYTAAERFRIHDVRGDAAVRRGMLLQVAEQELARGNADEALSALDVLDWEFPLERLNGPSTVLRARAELKRGNAAEALVQLDDLVRVAPGSNSAAEALFLAAEIERKLGRTAEALRRYERLAEEYRDSPRATDARLRLGALRSKRK